MKKERTRWQALSGVTRRAGRQFLPLFGLALLSPHLMVGLPVLAETVSDPTAQVVTGGDYTRQEPANKVTKLPRIFYLNDSQRPQDKTDFAKVFIRTGQAGMPTDYDQGVQMELAPNQKNTMGALALNSKISLDYKFSWTGSIGFSNPAQSNFGMYGDGIAFFLHAGDPRQLGGNGSGFGAEGLPYVQGVKFDLYKNGYQAPNAGASNETDRLGWEADPDNYSTGQNQGYGATISTSYETHSGVTGWYLHCDESSVAQLPAYINSGWWTTTQNYFPLNQGSLSITYDPNQNNGSFTVTYTITGDTRYAKPYTTHTWTLSNVKTYYNEKGINEVSFSLEASNGSSFHKTTLGISTFEYMPKSGEINVPHIAKEYDGQAIDYASVANQASLARVALDGSQSAISDFQFLPSDFVYYKLDETGKESAQPVAPIDVGNYSIRLSNTGMQRLKDLEDKYNTGNDANTKEILNFGNLLSYGNPQDSLATTPLAERSWTVSISSHPITIGIRDMEGSIAALTAKLTQDPLPIENPSPSDKLRLAPYSTDSVLQSDKASGKVSFTVSLEDTFKQTLTTGLQAGHTYSGVLIPGLTGASAGNYTVTTQKGSVTVKQTDAETYPPSGGTLEQDYGTKATADDITKLVTTTPDYPQDKTLTKTLADDAQIPDGYVPTKDSEQGVSVTVRLTYADNSTADTTVYVKTKHPAISSQAITKWFGESTSQSDIEKAILLNGKALDAGRVQLDYDKQNYEKWLSGLTIGEVKIPVTLTYLTADGQSSGVTDTVEVTLTVKDVANTGLSTVSALPYYLGVGSLGLMGFVYLVLRARWRR